VITLIIAAGFMGLLAPYIECIDGPPWGWTTNIRTMQRSFRIKWHMIGPWLGDLRRQVGMYRRIWRDRHLINPYGDT
jgi:hypothetical protein